MHAGNWELMGCTLAQKNYPLNAVVKTPKGDLWLELIDHNRVHNKAKLINVLTENMYRSTLNALKKNEIVIIMADTGATDSDKNLPIEFLGRKLPAASGWTTIAMRTGALVMPVLCSSSNKLVEDIVFPEILDPKNYQSETELLSAVLKHFSNFIAAHPTEWFIGLSESEVKKTFGK
jgi:lauroyl/myristoyl acyltransferase